MENEIKEEKLEIDYSKIDAKVEKIIKLAIWYMSKMNPESIESRIRKAYEFSKQAHHGQFRKSWEPYISHPVESAIISLSIKPDLVTIESCFLHDVIEDTDYTYDDIEKLFWTDVAKVCEWVEKVSKVKYRAEDRNIWSLRKMFVAMAEDIRVIFVKLSDRLHNMKTIKYHSNPEKIERIALETLNIYAPIADRLWLFALKNELEEECFKVLEPEEYKKIKHELSSMKDSEIAFRKNARLEIDALLKKSWIKYDIDFRVKSIYSIYKKMKEKWYEKVSDLYDVFGVRVMVENIETCYRVLWIIHNTWTPIPKKFKDYIALPKPNWYKSLHTTIIGLISNYRKQATEIQIRTYDMHLQAEIWIAAHFEYKENGSIVATDVDWIKEIKDAVENLGNSDFMDSLKIDVFKDRIFLFTPKWDTVDMPAWSTPIDFAYELHTELWNHIMIAKVNWKTVTLDRELHNWDVIEIITDKSRKANPLRLSFVKTTKARAAIKSFLKKENKDLHRERWREILNKYLERIEMPVLDKDLSILRSIDWREYSLEERFSFLEQIWNFSLTPSNLIRKIVKTTRSVEHKKWNLKNELENEIECTKDIYIWWEKNIDYVLWTCCNPTFWDKIVAHINRKWIITIHKRDCLNISKLSKERLIWAYYEWDERENILVHLKFIFLNRMWVLKNLSDILYSMNINVLEMSSWKQSLSESYIDMQLDFLDYDYLIIDRFLDRVKLKMNDTFVSVEIKKIEW